MKSIKHIIILIVSIILMILLAISGLCDENNLSIGINICMALIILDAVVSLIAMLINRRNK